MKIEDIVSKKGSEVVTISASASIADLVALLAERNIGGVVVSADGRTIDGIITERDVVRRLATEGAPVLQRTVGELMTTQVLTCQPGDTLEETAHTMTYSRIRHLPVAKDGELAGIVSIGDVVKYRIDQLTDERNHLLEYLHT
jgi:CBS domain-containing protein